MTHPGTLKLETVECPLCGESGFRTVFTGDDPLYHIPGDFQLVRCTRCRHVYLNPRPTLEEIIKCYPDTYGPYQAAAASNSAVEPPARMPAEPVTSAAGQSSPWYLNRWVKSIPGLRSLYRWLTNDWSVYIPENPDAGRRALDIGCSSGGFLEKLREQGWQAEGVELAEAPAEVARSKGFSVHTGTLESAHHDPDQFDAVFAYMVLEHLHHPRETVQEVHRILKPEGQFVFSVPNYSCWERFVFGRYWRGLELPRHLQHFTPRILKQLLRDEGFDCIRIIHQSNANNIVASIGMWLRDRFPRRNWGQHLIDYTDNPSLKGRLLLAPLAKLMAFCRQGGRLTAVATKRSAVSSHPTSENPPA